MEVQSKYIVLALLAAGLIFAFLGYMAFANIDISLPSVADILQRGESPTPVTSPLSTPQDSAGLEQSADTGKNLSQSTPKPAISGTSTPKPSATPISLPTLSPTTPAAAQGFACAGTLGFGVTCLGEGGLFQSDGWQIFTKESSPLGGDHVKDIAVCPDKRLLMLHTFGVSAFDGRTWKDYPSGWGSGSANALACAPDGTIWVAHFEGVSAFDKSGLSDWNSPLQSEWTTYPSTKLAESRQDASLVEDIAVAPDGQVWVATSNTIATFDSRKWKVYQQGMGFEEQYFFGAIALDSEGHPWAAHGHGLLNLDGASWTAYPNRDLITVESLAVDMWGRVWVGTFSKGVYVFDGEGWTEYNRENSGLSNDHIRAITVDAQNRVWIGTRWGVNIFDGETWRAYRMDNADLIDHDIYALGVVDGGPALVSPEEKPLGSLSGRVVYANGEPATGAIVEICIETLGMHFYGETPCDGQPLIRRTETTASGDFRLEELPAGRYSITYNAGLGWQKLTGAFGISSKRVLVKPSENTYVSELMVTEESE